MANDALASTVGVTAIRYSMLVIAVTALFAGIMILLSGRHLERGRVVTAGNVD